MHVQRRMFRLCFLSGIILMECFVGASREHRDNRNGDDITLWIDKNQVKEYSGYPYDIFAIANGVVLQYLLDPNFEKYLPIIPSEVSSVNFTWKSGDHKYFYDFDQLKSYNESILGDPVISIKTKGKVPKRPKVFQVFLPCRGNLSGIVYFGIGLTIQNEQGTFLPGTPLRFRLQKQCANHGPDPECDKKCANGGRCNQSGRCECKKGYNGQYCRTALCYPQCMNGGTCVSPGQCLCADGYQGPHCEGGMCREKCLNGGKCIQKDTCACRNGYYGARCDFSKCENLPCLNGGRCVGVNRCRCKRGFTGNQCEKQVERPAELARHEGCRRCVNGVCENHKCVCDKGWIGNRCNKRALERDDISEDSTKVLEVNNMVTLDMLDEIEEDLLRYDDDND
ncbi:protein shifted isoform X1 [Parasteatoda tepidariorum]|uniref:protein shifted isoform X1 n=1 Tax=Parasteatoda tepidariorum TaxID=114398 RepID=UPI001C72856B|nr:protein shifted isoform X3 [Parasteatoda tepidariorum]